MIPVERTALVLLAAGRSLRFGETDKLQARIEGMPLGLRAAATFERMPFAMRIAVVSADVLGFGARGWTVVRNPAPEDGMSGSVRLGVAEARRAGVDAVVIALADMPFVTEAHVRRLLDRSGPDAPVVASLNDGHAGPPAVFAADRFDELTLLAGDAGARTMIRAGVLIAAPPADMVDIDTPADLAAYGEGGAA
jgi:molybdenum cofactor cytidylyltransferase